MAFPPVDFGYNPLTWKRPEALLSKLLGRPDDPAQDDSEWDAYEIPNIKGWNSRTPLTQDNAPDPDGPLSDRDLGLYMNGVRPDMYPSPEVTGTSSPLLDRVADPGPTPAMRARALADFSGGLEGPPLFSPSIKLNNQQFQTKAPDGKLGPATYGTREEVQRDADQAAATRSAIAAESAAAAEKRSELKGKVADAEALLTETMRGDTPWATMPNPTMPTYTMGTDKRIPLNPAAVNTQMDDFLDRRHTADQARGYGTVDQASTGEAILRRVPMGQMPAGYETTQRVGKVGPAAKTQEELGDPKWKNPNANLTNDELPTEMDRYGQYREEQRKRLLARGMDQRGIDAQMQTGRLGKENVAGMRAMANQSMREGLSPEQAFAQARVFDNNQPGSYATPDEKTKATALYEKLMEGPRNNNVGDQLALIAGQTAAGRLDIDKQRLKFEQEQLEEARRKETPEYQQEQQDKQMEIRRNSASYSPVANPADQAIENTAINNGKPPSQKLLDAMYYDLSQDLYDEGDTFGDVGKIDEETWVQHSLKNYPRIDRNAAVQIFRRHLLPRYEADPSGTRNRGNAGAAAGAAIGIPFGLPQLGAEIGGLFD